MIIPTVMPQLFYSFFYSWIITRLQASRAGAIVWSSSSADGRFCFFFYPVLRVWTLLYMSVDCAPFMLELFPRGASEDTAVAAGNILIFFSFALYFPNTVQLTSDWAAAAAAAWKRLLYSAPSVLDELFPIVSFLWTTWKSNLSKSVAFHQREK